MVAANQTRVSNADLNIPLRYRSTLAIAAGLFALSAVVMSLFFRGTAPSMEGEPGYLFSIPAKPSKSDVRASLSGPLGVAAYGDKIAVADSGEGKVKVYGFNGRFLSEIDLTRIAGLRRKRAYPTGVAYDDEGRLFVTDIASDRIYVFDAGLNPLNRFPEKRQHIELRQPVAIAVQGDELFVADVGDSSIKVFSLDGTLARELAAKETRKVALAFPNGIGTTVDGTVYVADSNNRKVLAFDPEGRELFAFEYQFGLPRGLAVDSLGRVHVVDTFAHQVVVFNPEGKLLFTYGSVRGPNAGGLSFGNGIAVDSSTARAYVTDRGANRVQVFGWE